MIIFIFIMLILGISIESKFSPRLVYIHSTDRLLLWYNTSKYNDRNYIIIYEK